MSDSGDRDLRSGDLLLLDMVSISSNLLTSSITEINRRESRRNSRRLFWDALSRRNFRRLSDSSTIVFAAGLADELGSHDRWLVDFSGDLHFRAGHDIDLIGARYDGIGDRRRLFRSEVRHFTRQTATYFSFTTLFRKPAGIIFNQIICISAIQTYDVDFEGSM